MPFLLSISFYFPPLLRVGDREAAAESGAVCGHRSRPAAAALPARRTGLGCGNRAGRSIGSARHRRRAPGARGCLGGAHEVPGPWRRFRGRAGSASAPGRGQPPAPRPCARSGAPAAEASGQCPGLCWTLAPLSFLPRTLGAVVLEGKGRSCVSPSRARPRCDGA